MCCFPFPQNEPPRFHWRLEKNLNFGQRPRNHKKINRQLRSHGKAWNQSHLELFLSFHIHPRSWRKLTRNCAQISQWRHEAWLTALKVPFIWIQLQRHAVKSSRQFHKFSSAIPLYFCILFLTHFTWGGLRNAFTQFRYHYHPFSFSFCHKQKPSRKSINTQSEASTKTTASSLSLGGRGGLKIYLRWGWERWGRIFMGLRDVISP